MVPAPFIAVVDANVLFHLTVRDTLLRAAGNPPISLAELLRRLARPAPDLVAAVRTYLDSQR